MRIWTVSALGQILQEDTRSTGYSQSQSAKQQKILARNDAALYSFGRSFIYPRWGRHCPGMSEILHTYNLHSYGCSWAVLQSGWAATIVAGCTSQCTHSRVSMMYATVLDHSSWGRCVCEEGRLCLTRAYCDQFTQVLKFSPALTDDAWNRHLRRKLCARFWKDLEQIWRSTQVRSKEDGLKHVL